MLSESPISKRMDVYLRTVENISIKLVRGFKWPSSESMGKQWIMKLCTAQQMKDKNKTIGNKISATRWLTLKNGAKYQVVSEKERDTFDMRKMVTETIYIDSARRKSNHEENVTLVSVGVQQLSISRKVDRLLYGIQC